MSKYSGFAEQDPNYDNGLEEESLILKIEDLKYPSKFFQERINVLHEKTSRGQWVGTRANKCPTQDQYDLEGGYYPEEDDET